MKRKYIKAMLLAGYEYEGRTKDGQLKFLHKQYGTSILLCTWRKIREYLSVDVSLPREVTSLIAK